MQRSENPLVLDDGALEDATGLALFFLEDAPINFRGPDKLNRFYDELDEALDRTQAFPASHPLFRAGYRRCLFQRMRCKVLYWVYATETVVFGVAYESADPETIFQRIEDRRQARNDED
ncbi:MAG: hypothetical protein P1V97_34390 [Planctomycetota bacterium]|nr:hypothetical protein [Planctomycetota bacterium]